MVRWFAFVAVVLCLTGVVPARADDAANKRPPTAIRWDADGRDPAYPASNPQIYKLGARPTEPCAAADAAGNLYFYCAKGGYAKCAPSGDLVYFWRHAWSYDEKSFLFPGKDFYALADGTFMFGPACRVFYKPEHREESFVRKIASGETQWTELPAEWRRNTHFAAWDDAGYCIYNEDYVDGRTHPEIIVHDADGSVRTRWDTPLIKQIAPGPGGSVYALTMEAYDKGSSRKIIIYGVDGKELRSIDLRSVLGNSYVPEHIAVDANGDVYLHSDYMYRLDSFGHVLARWRLLDPPEVGGSHGEYVPWFSVRDGLLYTSRVMSVDYLALIHDELQVYTPDGQCVARYIPEKKKWYSPTEFVVLNGGEQLVREAFTRLYDAGGNQTLHIRDIHPGALCAAPDGGFYIAGERSSAQPPNGSTRTFCLDRFDSAGKFVQRLYGQDYVDTSDPCISAISTDRATGDLWAVTMGLDLLHYDSKGNLLKRIQQLEGPHRQFMDHIAVDPAGTIYLSEMRTGRVMKYDFSGNPTGEYNALGQELGQLKGPGGLAVDSKGRLYVCETGNCRVQVFSREGKALGWWGRRGSGDGELDHPQAVSIGPGDEVCICDTLNDRVIRLSQDAFWRGVRTTSETEATVRPPERLAALATGEAKVDGVVVAGTDDFTDCAYIESPDRAWGVRVMLPRGKALKRGLRCSLSGAWEDTDSNRRFAASAVEELGQSADAVPVGIANMYVGDANRGIGRKSGASTRDLLVRTWGSVIRIDRSARLMEITDGSFASGRGLTVLATDLLNELTAWPQVGDYIAVTGISTVVKVSGGDRVPAVRLRDDADVQVLVQAKQTR